MSSIFSLYHHISCKTCNFSNCFSFFFDIFNMFFRNAWRICEIPLILCLRRSLFQTFSCFYKVIMSTWVSGTGFITSTTPLAIWDSITQVCLIRKHKCDNLDGLLRHGFRIMHCFLLFIATKAAVDTIPKLASTQLLQVPKRAKDGCIRCAVVGDGEIMLCCIHQYILSKAS